MYLANIEKGMNSAKGTKGTKGTKRTKETEETEGLAAVLMRIK